MVVKKGVICLSAFALVILLILGSVPGQAQTKSNRISIATGGTGGVYYPMGGGMANSSPSMSPTPRPRQR